MKKFLLFPLFVCSLLAVPEISFAGCNSPTVLGYDGNQEPADDEFLYDTEEEFLLAKQGFINSKKQNSGDGHGYECDQINSPSCTIGDVREMPAGHVFKGEVIPTARRYQCQVGRIWNDDKWVVVDDNTCSTEGFGDILVGKCVMNGNVCKELTKIDCSAYEKTDMNGTKFHGICMDGPKFVCKAIECREGMHAENGICVIDSVQDNQEKKPEETATPSAPVVKNSCVQSRCGGLTGEKRAECITCCYVPSSTAVWNGDICKCADDSLTFNPSSLMCESGNVNTVLPVYTCDVVKMQLLSEWKIKYADNTEISNKISALITYCGDAPIEVQFDDLFASLQVLIGEVDSEASAAAQLSANQGTSRTNILNAISKLDNLSSGFKESVWKNEEGEFNTSRLISDSVAGVVLGTAGGLITSSVVKKNQVENGFEDIQCTVGGQVVAGWGDQFQVGIQ